MKHILRFVISILLFFVVFEACARSGTVSSALVKIDGGSFGIYDEKGGLRNTITLSSFLMSKYVVTNEEWEPFKKVFQKKIGSQVWAHGGLVASEVSPDPDMPAVGMNWYAAIEYCNWRSKVEGLKPVYTLVGDWDYNKVFVNFPTVTADWTANGYRLPTVAEWMFAYTERGKKTTKYPGSNVLNELQTTGNNIHFAPVGTKKPSAQGIYDLLGDVSQWCWDYFGKDYLYTADKVNPHGPESVKFDPAVFTSHGEGSNPATPWYKTARFVAGGPLYQGIILRDLAAVSRQGVAIRLVRNSE